MQGSTLADAAFSVLVLAVPVIRCIIVFNNCLWHREYEDGMEELAPISVLDVVMALQRQGAIGQVYVVPASVCRPIVCFRAQSTME